MKYSSHAGNEFTGFSKWLVYLALFALFLFSAFNLAQGKVNNPQYFFVVLIGALMVILPKLYVILKLKQRISFGSEKMPNWMAGVYKFGYWIMAVGFLFTFI